ncbi:MULTISPECIES: septum formation family protein [Arthrobacter]|uniref:Septum formation family protein n=2 Tax=Arthrobacter TaxID=1663 RepID=A0ABU9KM28_9MICC|nr:septum formation family protein [Arthrobacter sp. YJM1]MDP5228165.1 septum formation family protein [Arthrobacter sp. YJM1]
MSEPTQGPDDAGGAAGGTPGGQNLPPEPDHAPSVQNLQNAYPGHTPQPFSRTTAANRDRKRLMMIGGAALGGVVVILLIIWLVNLVVGGMTPHVAPDGTATTSQSSQAPSSSPSGGSTTPPSGAQTISALDAKQGECFWGYPNDSNSQLVVVDCGTAHSAQLVNVFYYQSKDAFPGTDAFKTKGRELCRTATLSPDVDSVDLRQRYAYPSQKSWDAGDRRVDCIIFTEAGNSLTESLAK